MCVIALHLLTGSSLGLFGSDMSMTAALSQSTAFTSAFGREGKRLPEAKNDGLGFINHKTNQSYLTSDFDFTSEDPNCLYLVVPCAAIILIVLLMLFKRM